MNNIDNEMEEKLKTINSITNRQLYDFNNRLGYNLNISLQGNIVNYSKYTSNEKVQNNINNQINNDLKNKKLENNGTDDLENHIHNLLLNSSLITKNSLNVSFSRQ